MALFMSLDLDLFFAAWDQTHNKRKALKLYLYNLFFQTIAIKKPVLSNWLFFLCYKIT